MEAIMKRLILAVCLVFMVRFGFARNWYPKTFATDTLIGTKYDDGKIKYALTEDEIIKQVVYDYSFYFNGLIDSNNYGTEGIEKIDINSCRFFIMEDDGVVYLKAHYSFLLLSGDYDEGIPLKEKNVILNKVLELSKEAWEIVSEDPIMNEIMDL